MNKEVIYLLEQALNVGSAVREIPAPYQGRQRLTDALINKSKREGRK